MLWKNAPRSGLSLKKFIDVGAWMFDADYRGELGVVLFNFVDTDFQKNMGDKVAQLTSKKIKIPAIKEVNILELFNPKKHIPLMLGIDLLLVSDSTDSEVVLTPIDPNPSFPRSA